MAPWRRGPFSCPAVATAAALLSRCFNTLSALRAAAPRPRHVCARPTGFNAAPRRSKACKFISKATCGVSTACCDTTKAGKQRSPALFRSQKAKKRTAQATNETKITYRQARNPQPAAAKQPLTKTPCGPCILKYVSIRVKFTPRHYDIAAQNSSKRAVLCFFTAISPGTACHHFLENAKGVSAANVAGWPPTGHDKTAVHLGDRPPHGMAATWSRDSSRHPPPGWPTMMVYAPAGLRPERVRRDESRLYAAGIQPHRDAPRPQSLSSAAHNHAARQAPP